MDELYRNIQKLNGLCGKNKLYWFIEYRIGSYIGKLDSGNVGGQLAYIEADYLDDLVERLIKAIESRI